MAIEGVLIDTDALIDYYRKRLKLPSGYIYYVSEVSVYEYIRGTKSPEEAKMLLEESFASIKLENEIIVKASEIWRDLRKKGEIIDDRDLLVGSTAIVYDLKLMTKNQQHFKRLVKYGLKLFI